MKTIYDFTVKDAKGNEISLEQYKGKVLLIVNTATKCGFTPQYEGLQALYAKYKEQGFEILDFPCNQFLSQAPGSDEELASFCQLRFGTTFKTFAKIEVNGKNANPLYVWLKKNSKSLIPAIKWNFTKFLMGKDGTVTERFEPAVKPEELQSSIEKLLK